MYFPNVANYSPLFTWPRLASTPWKQNEGRDLRFTWPIHCHQLQPTATQAAIKGLTPEQVEALGITLILNNTYHLNLWPVFEVLNTCGGTHKFQGWNCNLLTVGKGLPKIRSYCLCGKSQDSGGFEQVLLSKFTNITEEGAPFSSSFNGEPTMLTVRS